MGPVAPVIGRAPVRISFGGGGTDFEAFYSRFGGIVVSATIDRYVYAIPTSDVIESYYWQNGRWWRQKDITWLRAAMKHLGMDGIRIASQVPPGTGLGSSGSLLVAMIKALGGNRSSVEPVEIAELACHIEIDLMGMPIGKQDQYAAAFGGLNVIEFSKTGITVRPVMMPTHGVKTLEQRLMLFFLGNTRKSLSILEGQKQALEQGDKHTIRVLQQIGQLGRNIADSLRAGDLDRFGRLLDRSWQCKRTLAPDITNRVIDDYYNMAKRVGAMGGKLTGAGGGGFLVLYCHEEKQDNVTGALYNMGARRMRFKFDWEGARWQTSEH